MEILADFATIPAMLILSHWGHPAANAGENTIEAFQEAVRRGAQGIESDADREGRVCRGP